MEEKKIETQKGDTAPKKDPEGVEEDSKQARSITIIKKNKNKKRKEAQEIKITGIDDPPEEEVKRHENHRPKQKGRESRKPLFEEVEGGYYDEMNFYILPNNKGFYDPKGVYFNPDGFNAEGGYYDEDGKYFPPKRDPAKKKPRNEIEDDEELIRQFEGSLAEEDDVEDEV